MILVTHEPLSSGQILEALKTDASGSVVIHVGIVRPFSEGREVAGIEYEGDVRAAEDELSIIRDEIMAKWQVQDVALYRRIGRLNLGELILIAAVSAGHREEAFEACRYAVERLKAVKSIAKKEIWREDK